MIGQAPTRNVHGEGIVRLRGVVERGHRQQVPAAAELDGVSVAHVARAAAFGRRTAELDLFACARFGASRMLFGSDGHISYR